MRTFLQQILLLPFLLPFVVHAQADLLSDPEITWVGEFYSDYRFSTVPPSLGGFVDSYDWNTVAVGKMLHLPNENGFLDNHDGTDIFWNLMMMDWLSDFTIPAYKDAALLQLADEAYRSNQISAVDTSASFDPDNYEETLTIVRSEINCEDLVGVRVRQVLFYKKKEEKLLLRALSFSPILASKDNKGNLTDLLTLVWFPISMTTKPAAFWASNDVPYIFETKSRGSSPKIDGFSSLKGRFDFKKHVQATIDNPSSMLLGIEGDYRTLTADDRFGFVEHVDTFITFHPETFEETLSYLTSPNAVESLESVHLVNTWYFDDKAKKLYCRFAGYAPVVAIKNVEGNFLYSMPIFYVKGD